jgi:hypothetical protein
MKLKVQTQTKKAKYEVAISTKLICCGKKLQQCKINNSKIICIVSAIKMCLRCFI